MGNWKFPPDGGHMEKPSKIYYQTMTKKDVEERLKVNDILLGLQVHGQSLTSTVVRVLLIHEPREQTGLWSSSARKRLPDA